VTAVSLTCEIGTDVFEDDFDNFHLIKELFNSRCYWWRRCDVAALFL